jgi:dienelactone hydrolase
VDSREAVKLTDGDFLCLDENVSIKGIDLRGFTDDGEGVFVDLVEKDGSNPNPRAVKVDVWSYFDKKLQSQQLLEFGKRMYVAILRIKDRQIIRLEKGENDRIVSLSKNFAIVGKIIGGPGSPEWTWNWDTATRAATYLVSLNDGTRKLINDNLSGNIAANYRFSNAGRFIIYFNPCKRNYFSYEVRTGNKRNITAGIDANWTEYGKRDLPIAKYMPINNGVIGWIGDDLSVLLYDQNDIFEVDPLGERAPRNLTFGYGRQNAIEFKLATKHSGNRFEVGEKLILSAFNRINKDDGFFSIVIGKRAPPQILSMQPYFFRGSRSEDNFSFEVPGKARDAESYLVKRMSAEESPNYFWTEDFRRFHAVSDVHPENGYNWLKTELLTWKTFDGTSSQGILYKPENFDPRLKYPIIFYYYEKLSDGLHGFIFPDFCTGPINIPYFVSNGYLVFAPDIHYTIGHPGRSVLNCILSAARYLAEMPFVDSSRMGIQGHSRGGWETNFLITHTNRFAAAMSASGMSDYIGLYNSVRLKSSGISGQSAFESLNQRIGATLWERPDLYVENSPVFQVNRVVTPLLMMSNKEDTDVPFEQGIEFYTALRRLGKKVWLLQYDGQGHMVFGDAARDLTIRMRQFFDHYLKGTASPKWMATGVPARVKGVDSGLELTP